MAQSSTSTAGGSRAESPQPGGAGGPLPLEYTAESAGHTNIRWVVCALLFFATTINYIDRQILSLLKETLDKELGWTNAEFGLVNSAFQFAYGLSFLFFGWFIDRYGTKIGYALSIFLWSIAAAGHSLVHSVNGFLAARMCLGFGEAGNFPAAIKATAQWFPKRERAFSTSIFNSGANVGAIIAPATIPFIAASFGWRGTFVVAGLLGFIWLIFWWIFYEVPERHRTVNQAELNLIRSDRDESQQERKLPWGSIIGYPQTWSFITAKFLTDPVWWFFLIWLPDFFKKTRGLDIKKSWIHIVTIYVIVTILSIFGGWVPGYLVKRGWSVTAARKTSMFVFALCVVPILLVTRASDWGAVFLIGLAGAAHQAWSANLFTTTSDMFPKRAVATVVGLGGLAGSAGGILFPIGAGMLLDHFEKLGNATAGYAILFSICGFAYLVAFVINHLLAPRFEQVQLPAEQAGFPVVPAS
jgi:ACS family hexuronate transporter-like MFS transporter